MHILRKPASALEARRLYTDLQSQWSAAFTRDKQMRDLINQKNKIEVIKNHEGLNIKPMEIHSGRPGSILDGAQSFVGTLPSVNIDPVDQTIFARSDSEQTERGFMSLFHQQLVSNDFWHNLGRNLLMFGRGVLVCLPLPSVWIAQTGYPVRKKGQRAQAYIDDVNEWKKTSGKLPLVITHVPSDDILLKLDSNDKVLIALETKYMQADRVAKALGSKEVQELLNRGSLNWYDQLPILQYIDDQHVIYFLTSTKPYNPTENGFINIQQPYKRLKSWEHGLGKCPVVLIPAVKTDEKALELRFKPFLADAEESLEAFDFLISRLATMVQTYYFPSYELKIRAESQHAKAGQQRRNFEILIGGVTHTYEDETLIPLQVPANLPDASLLQGQLSELISRSTLEDVLLGRSQGNQAAFAIRLKINVAKQKLIPHVTHLAQGLTEIFDLVARSIEYLGDSVIIDGEKITIKMAKQARGRIGVSIDAKLPGEEGTELGKARMASDLGLPELWIWEHILGIDDPATLRILRDIEELEKDPEIRAAVLADAKEQLQTRIEDDETISILDALTQHGDRLDPEVIAALQGLLNQPGEGGEGEERPVPPPDGRGPGRGPFPGGGSPQATGGGRGLGTRNAPKPSQQEVDAAGVETEE